MPNGVGIVILDIDEYAERVTQRRRDPPSAPWDGVTAFEEK